MSSFETPFLAGSDITRDMREGMGLAFGHAVESAMLHRVDLSVGAQTAFQGTPGAGGFASDNLLGDKLMHAEVVAIRANGENPIDTLYATAEPCVQCQDYIAGVNGLTRVIFALPRKDLSDMGLVNFHEQTAAERVKEKGYDYDVIELRDPAVQAIARAIFSTNKRVPGQQPVETDSVTLVRKLADLSAQGYPLGLI